MPEPGVPGACRRTGVCAAIASWAGGWVVGDSRAQQGCPAPTPPDVRTDSRQGRGKVLQQAKVTGQKAASTSRGRGELRPSLPGRAILRVPLKPAGPAGLRERPPPALGELAQEWLSGAALLGLWAVPNSWHL